MKIASRVTVLILAGVIAVLPAQADPGRVGGIQDRMERQQAAIDRGLDSGALTRSEARSLQYEQREIRRVADDLRRNGRSPEKSRRTLDRMLDRADWHLRDLLHNDEVRYDDDGYARPPRHPRPGFKGDPRTPHPPGR